MKDGNTYPQDNKKRSSPSLDFIVGSIFTCVFFRNNLTTKLEIFEKKNLPQKTRYKFSLKKA
jgi:hypothetical protein